MRAKSNTTSDILCFAGNIQTAPACPGRNDHCGCDQFLSGRSGQYFITALHYHIFYPAMFEDIDRIIFHMRHQVECQLLTGRLGNGDHILDAHRLLYLTAYTIRHDCHIQPFTRCVNSSRTTGRATAHNDHIIVLFYYRQVCFFHAILSFQLTEQLAEITPTHMDQFAAGKDRRNTLHFHGFHFFLIDRSVHHLMRDLRVQRSHSIQSLYYVRTVGTGQRDISCQLDRTVQSFHAVADTFVGNILSFPVTVQKCQQQGGKFMSIGNTTEFNTGLFPIFQ